MMGELLFAIAVPVSQMLGLVLLGLVFRVDKRKDGIRGL